MVTTEIAEKIQRLEEKYAAMGQSLSAYLDGLLYADYLTYWDYIQLDVLLNLQHPRTPIPDENIFIIYHQITELYFKLSLQAIEQICHAPVLTVDIFKTQLKRINNYFRNLVHSFEIMVDGMDKEQFLQFRMALLPASGFQSGQFRMIEICSTRLLNLVYEPQREALAAEPLKTVLDNIYWRNGATELSSGKKTLTLRQFELKYMEPFLSLATRYEGFSMQARYQQLSPEEQQEVIPMLKEYDLNINVRWPLMHYKSAVRYLHKKPEDIAATGGTNWQQYLPPKNKRIVFFPELWTTEELDNWGKLAMGE
ncbi:tryptophan 2,3-dioxygenase family protein [Chitinophaga nivalis]|uniref:Tryptophan 2,3-dioxygenase family protein n=1 Tax=Chitinophaga nivalis TaxID=2991709 RepID=A0ABT3IW77_9BACT|nr:tryptophan 2,3-dioxygenase family protein [Chitinophaga nivalis]MCW3462157.1 tryptophan 2,3-dioxygenase family protein [Chitinophaga nivalis]MCW3488151.1 tryptophan 2,3-dioxygenase family protein [Chitinophaga nivalis]